MSEQDLDTKLAAARTRLIIDKPFLGALVLRLPMVKGDPKWCKTTATDARKFYYNAEYINDLSLAQTQFVLAHEALHCALSHFARRQHRVRHRWDLACDFAVNPILLKDGLTPPPNALYQPTFDGMSAEEIYPMLDDFENETPQDQHVYDESDSEGEDPQGDMEPPTETPSSPQDQPSEQGGDNDDQEPDSQPNQGQGGDSDEDNDDNEADNGSGTRSQLDEDEIKGGGSSPEPDESEAPDGAPQPAPLSHSEREALSVQWKQRLAGAAQTAMQAGKLGEDMARLVDFLLQPELPWRSLLARYMSSVARDDYSYTRPNPRRGDPAIYPSLRSQQVDIVVAIDTSGSVTDAEIQEFISEIDAIKGQMRARITLIACDAELSGEGPWIYEPWDEFTKPVSIKGGGGTSFVPVFEWAERQDRYPELLIYFTDAEGQFPKYEPGFPVIWLVKGKTPVPWGQRIQLN